MGLFDERKSEPKATEASVHKEYREVLGVYGSSMSERERNRSVRKIYHFSMIFRFSRSNLIVDSEPTSLLARSAYSARRGLEKKSRRDGEVERPTFSIRLHFISLLPPTSSFSSFQH